MKRGILFICLGILAAVILYQVLGSESYVLFKMGETTVKVGLWLVLIGLVIFYYSWKLLSWLIAGLFGGGWMRNIRTKQKETNRSEGIRALLEGNWSMAKAELTRLAKAGENSKYNYLLAARCSELMGNSADADKLLATARKHADGRDLAIDLEQIRFHLQRMQVDSAVSAVDQLSAQYPDHSELLSLKLQALMTAERWQELRQAILAARKKKQFKPSHQKIEKQLYLHLIDQKIVGDEEKLAQIREVHSEMPAALLKEPPIIYALADHYRKVGEHDRAEQLLRQTINATWEGSLVRLYGEVHTSRVKKQLSVAERWLRKHPNDIDLLHTLENLSRRADNWEKARNYAVQARLGGEHEPAMAIAAPMTAVSDTSGNGKN